ncbi:MAG: hypothetical protein A3F82_05485 [Deltaproteobacteria bacterium RIFCSPLOWO2_12_FULL_44_12]|nr:MAG: hypothetical protein A2712_01820 [Deltaproteobacteria bacterium RIFCSPHIGHO2_01_FULL_43_49]OGQ15136.1 MAG: hypothetical protein A3D22_03655 [Deltaproteobacteria bacterium RIFCSPHIGHO2_02_FULL_44_53]OGQ27243.1 MAG: hypothetical protein A3D98_02415 [Deltaproteobacteria bacterium RIFCSPHIGHO2_12_FULL_44_21]OGQ31653.1 MAG: hypothetical protein A2979_04815 [Deltaproteobacteria bacterium RIFCSPLOWO2_01_FULL_45_74]OGQ42853.1 MAG: hypothetical protein A3I70_07120 [Deltaproteobacteria bacterium 
MTRKILKLCLLLPLILSSFSELKAQTRDGEFLLSAGAGMGWRSPVRFDLDFTGEYFWNDRISFGLNADTLLRGPASFSFVPFARYHFDLKKWPKFTPYAGAGMGALVNSRGQGWFDLMLPELGFFYELTPRIYIGPNVSLHVLAGSSSTWDFQTIGQVAYRF